MVGLPRLPRHEFDRAYLERLIAGDPDTEAHFTRYFGDLRARDAAYHFMSVMAGNLANFEEASRALFAHDRRRFAGLIADWPADIRDHVVRLAYSDSGG